MTHIYQKILQIAPIQKTKHAKYLRYSKNVLIKQRKKVQIHIAIIVQFIVLINPQLVLIIKSTANTIQTVINIKMIAET
jgi:hypothetical protein